MRLPDELIFLHNARRPQHTTDARLDNKLVILTGATSGVGLATAHRLAMIGANLFLICRNPDKTADLQKTLSNAYGTSIDYAIADFSKLAEVRQAARFILNRASHIDVLINNVGMHSTKRQLTSDGIDLVFCVNHLAPFLLTRLLLNRIVDSAPARIIQVSSEGHRFGGLNLNDLNWQRRPYHGLFSYGASKVAQLYTVRELARRLDGTGVTINAVHPGSVKSNIGMNNGTFYRWYKQRFVTPRQKEAHIAGKALVYLAAAPEVATTNGCYFNMTIDEPPASYTLRSSRSQKVWDLSESLTGLCTTGDV